MKILSAILDIAIAAAVAVLLAFVSMCFVGCSAEEFDHVVTATGRAAHDYVDVRDHYDHPERYAPRFSGYDAYGRPMFQ